jgi:hypothetical protein
MLRSLVVRHLRSVWLGLVAAVAFAAGHYANNYWFTAQTDGWSNLFLVASVLLYDRSLGARSARTRAIVLFSAGALIGFAFWLKYTTAAVLLVFPAIHLAQRLPWQRILADAVAISAGFLACVGAGIATLAAMGALAAFLDIQDFMRSYVAHGRAWWEFLLAPLLILAGSKVATAMAMIGLYAIYKSLAGSARRPEAVGLLVWIAAAWGSAVLQGKIIPYHLLPLLPPLAIAAAVGAQALIAALRRLTPRSFEGPIVAAACILIVWSSTVPTQYRTLGPALGGDGRALRTYWDSAGFGHDDFETKDNLALVDYLKAQTLPCDKVFIWGYEPGVYFLAQRRPVSRFVYNFPMFTAYYRQSYRDELMADLGRETPAVFVVQHEDRTPHVSVHNHDSAEVLEQFDALKSFVTANYRLRDKVGRFDVYFRRDIDPDAARACLAANPLAPAPRPR